MNTHTGTLIKNPAYDACSEDLVNCHSRNFSAMQCMSFLVICLSLSLSNTAWAACEQQLEAWIMSRCTDGRKSERCPSESEKNYARKQYEESAIEAIKFMRRDGILTSSITETRSQIDTRRKVTQDEIDRNPIRYNGNNHYTFIRQLEYRLCIMHSADNTPGSRDSGANSSPSQPRETPQSADKTQQNQTTQQQSQQAQQQAQQTQQLAAQNQTRADQARQGKRKTHEPAAEAHECIAIDNAGSGNFGAFKNTCSSRVNFYTCNYKPRVTQGGFNWSADFDCEKQQHGMHTPGAGVAVAAHNRNTETVHWFACKAPASPVDVSFVQGQGLSGRCN